MAFPTVAGTITTTAIGSAGTSHTVNLPSGITSGELLLVLFAVSDGVTIGWPGGWTELYEGDSGGFTSHAVAYRIANGTEGASITVTSGSSSKAVGISIRVTNWHGTTPPEVGSFSSGTSAALDPPTLTPSWGSADTLWFEFGHHEDNTAFTAASTSYTNLVTVVSGGSGGAGTKVSGAVARRELTATSDNPDNAFTNGNSTRWVANTLAVRPVASSNRQGRVSFVELETPNAPRRARISFAEIETPNAPRQARISFGEFEVPTAPRQSRISFVELEVPTAPRQARISFGELETLDPPRQARISFAELEVPITGKQALVSLFEFETPIAPRQARVSIAELEAPFAPRQALVSFVEFEAPIANKQARVSFFELETAIAPRQALVSFIELEAPTASRQARISFGELEAPGGPRQALVTFTEIEVPSAPVPGGTPPTLPILGVGI